MEFGSFSPDGKEYIITEPNLPAPWINYISNGIYCSLVSQTGGGYSFFKDPRDFRITRYRYNNMPMDRPGKYIYCRDNDDGTYWSVGYQPVMRPYQKWECRHGFGYSVISSITEGIESTATFFVPKEDNCEVWMTTFTNNSDRPRDITITYYVEFALFDAVGEAMSYPNLRFFPVCRYNKDLKALLYNHYYHSWFELGKVFFAVNKDVIGWECRRDMFIQNPRTETNPRAVEEGTYTGKELVGGDGVGALAIRLILAPGQSENVCTVLGVDQNKDIIQDVTKKYADWNTCAGAMEEVKTEWNEYFQRQTIETPDKELNMFVNNWNQYQCKVTFDWSRYASMYHTGMYRGYGFRDTSQDTLGVVHAIPKKVLNKIELLASNMYEDGHAYHQFFPVTKTGDATKYSDDHLWLIPAVYNYVCETGDIDILDREVTYIGESSKDTMYEHMMRSIEYTMSNMGPHGLPLMFYADWNDCLNNICMKERGQKGESVWTAMQLHFGLNLLAVLSRKIGNEHDVCRIEQTADTVRETVNKVAWDGDWYIRAFTDEGKKVGSKSCEEGRIYLMSQSWSVLSGIADEKRGKTAMDSVDRCLKTDNGLKLLTPAYRKFPKDIGSLIHYHPGIKENGAVFCHSNTWAFIAEAMLKRPERAFDYYTRYLPLYVSRRVGHRHYKVEPYVYCQFISGPDHPEEGFASHSWLSGTAAWSYWGFTKYIAGVRAAIDGLIVDPCIPKAWENIRVERKYRDAKYSISIRNTSGTGHTVKKMTVDGITVDPGPLTADKGTHTVEVDV